MSGIAILGIDPGLGGGLALLHPNDGLLLEPMPTIGSEIDLKALNDFLYDWAKEVRVCYLERATSRPGQGVTSTFKFGRVYGILEGMLAAYRVSVIDIRPQEWMSTMHLNTPAKMDTKDRSRIVFNKLFPKVDARKTMRSRVQDMGLVEAALIAEYGRRQI